MESLKGFSLLFFMKTLLLSPAEGQDIQNLVLKALIYKTGTHLRIMKENLDLDGFESVMSFVT